MASDAEVLFKAFAANLSEHIKFLRGDLSVSEEVFAEREREAAIVDVIRHAAKVALAEVAGQRSATAGEPEPK